MSKRHRRPRHGRDLSALCRYPRTIRTPCRRLASRPVLLAVTAVWAVKGCAPPSAQAGEATASFCQRRVVRSQLRFVVNDHGAPPGGGNPGSNVGLHVQLLVGTSRLTLCHQQWSATPSATSECCTT
jgi:hypothetical protein